MISTHSAANSSPYKIKGALMTTAAELWPPGSKYDVEAIRRRIKSCNSWTFDWDDWIDYGTKESADFFDVCRQRHPIWESVGEIKRNLADPVALDDARRLLLAFLDELLAASVSESELKIDLNADWEDWNVPPRRLANAGPETAERLPVRPSRG